MNRRLYVRTSLSQETKAAAWGAALGQERGWRAGGVLEAPKPGAVTLVELCAVERALTLAVTLRHVEMGDDVTIVMSSTAALAVLMWVLNAPCAGEIEIVAPKKLPAETRDLYALHHIVNDIDRLNLTVTLEYTRGDEYAVIASGMAKHFMKSAQPC